MGRIMVRKFTALWAPVLILIHCYTFSGCSDETIQATSFDIPRLVGKDVDGIIKDLGIPWDNWEPTTDDIKSGVKVWDKSWKSGDGKTFLVINYLISNRKVISFFIYTKESAQGTKNKRHLLLAGKLREDSPYYRTKFVPAKDDPALFTGITITPIIK